VAASGSSGGSIVKNVILGGAVGVVLACVWLAGVQLVNSKVACADRMARHFGLVHFGSVRSSRCIFPVLAQRLMNAQVWKDETQALDFIREKGSVHLPENGSVILVSTLPKMDEKLVNKLMDAMSAEGRTVSFAADMLHDPKALSGIRNADALVLLERAYATENAAVVSAMYLAEEMKKPICGFVMI
jgi:hypothetical protein